MALADLSILTEPLSIRALTWANSVNATRAEMGRPPLVHSLVYSYVGNGAPVLIRKAMGPEVSDAEVKHALQFFLDYYRDHAVDATELYPGVRESLDRLHAAGMQLAILTNKPVRISEAISTGEPLFALDSMMFRILRRATVSSRRSLNSVGIDTLRAETGASAEVRHGWWAIASSTCRPRATQA